VGLHSGGPTCLQDVAQQIGDPPCPWSGCLVGLRSRGFAGLRGRGPAEWRSGGPAEWQLGGPMGWGLGRQQLAVLLVNHGV
jgi:hypothetical protein